MADPGIISCKSTIVAREVGGEMVLLDLEAGTYFGLNAVGGRIWEALEEKPCSQAELAEMVSTEFDAEHDEVANDIAALIADLRSNGLVDVSTA